MARISDTAIEQIRTAVDLVDVVSDYVRLKKQGTRFVGLCPFHNEKTPSFSVDAQQGLFHCFGCKRGGDLYKFVEYIEGVGFLDAVRLLGARAGIELAEDDSSEERDQRESMLGALRFAAKFYFDRLKEAQGRRGLAYLKERGFAKETIQAFGIGYAPDSWDALLEAARAASFKEETLEAVGLIKQRQSGDGYYDVFRDRVMFPILSPVGKVLGFGGRVVPGSAQASDDYTPAKYINSPETEVFHKKEALYGIKQAKTAIRAAEEALLVEGYADVVSLHQAGINHAVACSGTALTTQQVKLISRYARSIVLLYDADSAGRAAAEKGIEVVLDGGLAVSVITLPEGADPDSFVQQFGAEAFRRMLAEKRQDFVSFLVRQAQRAGMLDTPEGKGETGQRLINAIARIENPIAQDEYVLRAAAELGVPDATLRPQLRRRLQQPVRDARRRAEPRMIVEERNHASTPLPQERVIKPEEATLLRLMLERGLPMIEQVLSQMSLEEFTPGAVRRTAHRLLEQYQAERFTLEPFLQGGYGGSGAAVGCRSLVDEAHLVRQLGAAHWYGCTWSR